MTKYLAVGLLAFVALCAALAPAGLLRPLLAPVGLSLSAPLGTIWSGGGDLHLHGHSLGAVEWWFDPAELTEPAIAYHWKLFDEQTHVHGNFAAGLGRTRLAAEGGFSAELVNPWLDAYGLRLGGEFGLSEATAAFAEGRVQSVSGRLEWSGGPVRYQLGGAWLGATLPPLGARVQFTAPNGAETPRIDAQVLTLDQGLPLVQIEPADSGYVKISVTRRLMKMANVPWLGEGADDAVALTLEEKLF